MGSGGARGAAPGGARGTRGGRAPKQRRGRRLRIALAGLAAVVVLMAVFVGVVYATTEVPDPKAVATKQTTTVFYADGRTVMARLGSENRTNVKLAQVAKPAQEAILAAENRNFYSDPGISFTGIVRAAWNDLTGSSTQGGSTITQQYVKNAFLSSEQSFTRKFKELFLAVKLDNNYTKDQILENYLNTIYFGRGAYGIEAAATTYFGVPASQLTAEQGAVLAVMVRNPSYYDPAKHPEEAKDRWGRVLDGMVEKKWLSATDRQAASYPTVLPDTDATLGMPKGPEGLVVSHAIDELEAKGYSDQQIRAGGLRITTTVQKKDEDAAIAAVHDVMQGQPDKLQQALVAVDPKTGAVLAYYGGEQGSGKGTIDYAQAQRAPGSSMKPYTLATGLEQGISVLSRRDGSSPQKFKDRDKPVRNSGNESCANCTLVQAITQSLNTTFYGLALEVGPTKVRQTALAAMDLPDTWSSGTLKGQKTLAQGGNTGGAIGIGQYEVRPIDQAHGFATLAAGGIERDPYFVAKVADGEGTVLLQNNGSPGKQVLPPDVASDVTYALEGVASYSHRSLLGSRPVASKTGTQGLDDDNNSDAWMVGYTPSISTAVWMGSNQVSGITTAQGKIIYGSGLPGAIWQQFMNNVLKGTPVEDLPDSPTITGDAGETDPEAVSAPDPTTSAPVRVVPQAPVTTQAPPTTATPEPAPTASPTESTPAPASTTAAPTSSTAASTTASKHKPYPVHTTTPSPSTGGEQGGTWAPGGDQPGAGGQAGGYQPGGGQLIGGGQPGGGNQPGGGQTDGGGQTGTG